MTRPSRTVVGTEYSDSWTNMFEVFTGGLRDDVLPDLEADGWRLISEPGQAPDYRLERDGYRLGWTFSTKSNPVATVGGTTPCFPVE